MKNKIITWVSVAFAVLLAIQAFRCVTMAFDQPRLAWKMVYLGAGALCGFTVFLLWRVAVTLYQAKDLK